MKTKNQSDTVKGQTKNDKDKVNVGLGTFDKLVWLDCQRGSLQKDAKRWNDLIRSLDFNYIRFKESQQPHALEAMEWIINHLYEINDEANLWK